MQIGVDICSLHGVDGFKRFVVLRHYFSKYLEPKFIKDKSASTITQFLYEIICRYGCMKIQITDQWSLNEVSKVLHNMIGIAQRIILAYHLQSNGLCKWQNRTIKDSLVKVLNENSCDWSIIIEGVLLSHRVNKHTSTNFSPFFFLYNKEPALPIDVKYDLVYIERNESEHPSSKKMFDSLLTTAISMRAVMHQTIDENICSAQKLTPSNT